ncbi:MAG TPA: winged helix-turn-helix domain-containing protein [Caulobacteraceae bacterium]
MSATGEHRPGDRFLFGPFELRTAERLLVCHDVPVALGSRAMDVLLCLLEHQDEVVSPDELLARAWHGVNVEPATLRVQIGELRRALAEVDPGARYVSTVSGRGYCFVVPVLQEADGAPAASTPGPPDRPPVPPALGRMIGRETVVDALERMVAAERLVTLVGPGGIGKTTVALALAQRMSRAFDGDVAFVDLSIQRRDDDLARAVATALRLTRLGGDPVADVALQLRSRRLLLILDSCEHVVAGAAALAEAVCQSAPKCQILATSREPLRAMGEKVHRLAALETPPPSETLSFEEVRGYPAAQLFVERVIAGGGQIEPGPADARLVADICRKLDGIPLAIELAAGRVHAFGLAMTRTQLDSQLRLSWQGRRTARPRHLTLGATLDWSYDLLSPEEARLLRALSMFVGSFPLDAAQAAADEPSPAEAREALAGLIAKSLVSADRGRNRVQYRLLDTTRDYARLKLEASGELPAAAARHAAWTLGDLRNQEAQLKAPWTVEWADDIANRMQDAQAALDWSLSASGDLSFTVPLTLASIPFWLEFDTEEQSTRGIEAALTVVEPDSRDEMTLNIAMGWAALYSNEVSRAEIAATRGLELANGFGDSPSQLRARLQIWNTYIGVRPNLPKARKHALLYRDLSERHGDLSEQIIAEQMISVSELVAGNLAAARASIDRAQALGPTLTSRLANTLQCFLWLDGMPDTGMAVAQDNLDRARATGIFGNQADVLADSCAPLAMLIGDLTGADHYADMIDDCVAHGSWSVNGTWVQILRATIAAHRGDAGPGRSFLARPLPPECGHPRFACVLTELALRLGAAGAEDVARDLADRMLRRVEDTGERWIWSEVQRVRGELTRDAATAVALFEAALAVAQQQGARAWALRAATSLARRRRGAAEDVLKPLLASFTEGFGTQDHVEARAVLRDYGLAPP